VTISLRVFFLRLGHWYLGFGALSLIFAFLLLPFAFFPRFPIAYGFKPIVYSLTQGLEPHPVLTYNAFLRIREKEKGAWHW